MHNSVNLAYADSSDTSPGPGLLVLVFKSLSFGPCLGPGPGTGTGPGPGPGSRSGALSSGLFWYPTVPTTLNLQGIHSPIQNTFIS